jgi:hypothetical protein
MLRHLDGPHMRAMTKKTPWPKPSRPGPAEVLDRGKPVTETEPTQIFYHGTRADLKIGDLIKPGRASNYGGKLSYVYLTATLDAAAWGAELAAGEGRGRIYIVEPTGEIVDDPNLTNTRFPGNPTKSYRSREPLRVTGEVKEWQGHSLEQIAAMKEAIKGKTPID